MHMAYITLARHITQLFKMQIAMSKMKPFHWLVLLAKNGPSNELQLVLASCKMLESVLLLGMNSTAHSFMARSNLDALPELTAILGVLIGCCGAHH